MAKAKTSITTENRSGSAADAAAKEKRTEMPLSDLHPFGGHPFKVLDDELMEQTVERDIRKYRNRKSIFCDKEGSFQTDSR